MKDEEEICGRTESWQAIKLSCLCLQDRLFQKEKKNEKGKNKIKELFWFRGIVILGAESKSGN